MTSGGGKKNQKAAATATATQNLMMTKKANKGRQKIEIKKVENDPHRHVTFSKRKNGLFKKATELSTLCGTQLAIILFSQHHKVFSCGRPDVDSVLRRFELHHARRTGAVVLDPPHPHHAPNNHHHRRNHHAVNNIAHNMNHSNGNNNNANGIISGMENMGISVQEQEYVKSVERLEEGKKVVNELTGFLGRNKKNMDVGQGFWWDTWRVDGMEEKDEVQCYKEAVLELKSKVAARIDAMAARNSAAESGIITDFILNSHINHHHHGHHGHGHNDECADGMVDVDPAISISISSPSS